MNKPVDLYVNYWRGDFYVGRFRSVDAAKKYYSEHKESFRDYCAIRETDGRITHGTCIIRGVPGVNYDEE